MNSRSQSVRIVWAGGVEVQDEDGPEPSRSEARIIFEDAGDSCLDAALKSRSAKEAAASRWFSEPEFKWSRHSECLPISLFRRSREPACSVAT